MLSTTAMSETTTDGAHEADDGGFDIGSSLGPYRLVRRIGRGGMGLVFEAVRADQGTRVAVKVLHTRVDGPVARERFLREGRAASRVRHPHAVEIFDSGVEGGVAWLAMEYLAGEDLAALMVREGALPVDRFTDLMLPVIAAIGAAHAEGIIHRDIKPENIFLTRSATGEPQPKVLDFGVARLLDEDTSLTSGSVLLGTPLYMSPEQAVNSRNASMLSDQYALGVVLYEGATGRLPFEQEGLFELLEAIVRAPVRPPRSLRAEIPAGFEEVVLRAMARAPAQRLPSVLALGATLLPFASPGARARWQPTFAPHTPGRTLLSFLPPVPLSSLTPPPRVAVTLDESSPLIPSSRPRLTSTLSDAARPVDVPVDAPAAAAASPRRARWAAAALVALSVAAAWVLVPRTPSAAPPPPRARARPAAVIAPAPAPAAATPAPTAAAPAPAPVVAAAPRAPTRRPRVARTSAPAPAAPHRPSRRDVLILH